MLTIISGLIAVAIYRKSLYSAVIGAILLLLPISFKSYQWYSTPLTDETQEIALIQGNIAQSLKWQPGTFRKYVKHLSHLKSPFYG